MAWASEEQPQRVRTTTLASLPAILGLSPAMVLPFIGAAGRRGQQQGRVRAKLRKLELPLGGELPERGLGPQRGSERPAREDAREPRRT
jgi:hypothetical protein